MGEKKRGRPTDNPKTIVLKVMLDQETEMKLEECTDFLEISKAEVVRRGIHQIHSKLEK
ncbi:CopG family transcriptional regulator [Candidatus Soleaferrea massiliensis]|uniref:CopG family transcriptional regulator n=1 Tax=Candidatus Soleaferrea massiliensis TaxID=1470354 RepID=UPI0009E4A0CD|nr:CopG family transcriptional regulator [Candidatus Soleaferrea massiliensis]